VNNSAGSLEEWQSFARKAEDLGFSTLVIQDHLDKQPAPFPALVAAAAVTTRLRLGTVVLDNDFRHPAVLAKEAATVDVLSDGRLELGLGAGWLAADYEQAGIAFDPPRVRLERLAEAVQICKTFFAGETVTFHGRHYQIDGLEAYPRPLQTPRPPIMIGGRQRRALALAAREADIVGISMLDPRGPNLPKPPTFAEKAGWVRAAAGPRFDEIEIHVNASNVEVTDKPQEALDRIAARLQVSPEELPASPASLVGSVAAIVEQLHAWRERCGVSYLVVQPRAMDAIAPVIAKVAGMERRPPIER
jgi:probable F420-dependent oxidoreductase